MSEVVSVPDVDGVPALNFAPGAELGIELLDSDGILGLPNSASQWGIYLNGAPVVRADSVIDFSLKKEWSLSDAPQEKGAFETYDKVIIPFDARVRFSAGGSLANRSAFLASIDAIAGDLNLYDVVTPENVYTSCNVTHYDYKRTASAGLGLITVDVWLFQVRVVNGSQTSDATNPDSGTGTGDTAEPSGADAANGGTVQTTDPSASENQAAGVSPSSGGFATGFAPDPANPAGTVLSNVPSGGVGSFAGTGAGQLGIDQGNSTLSEGSSFGSFGSGTGTSLGAGRIT